MSKFNRDEKPEAAMHGYMDEKRRVFVVTNYDECVGSGLLTKREERHSEDGKNTPITELLKKYRPQDER